MLLHSPGTSWEARRKGGSGVPFCPHVHGHVLEPTVMPEPSPAQEEGTRSGSAFLPWGESAGPETASGLGVGQPCGASHQEMQLLCPWSAMDAPQPSDPRILAAIHPGTCEASLSTGLVTQRTTVPDSCPAVEAMPGSPSAAGSSLSTCSAPGTVVDAGAPPSSPHPDR